MRRKYARAVRCRATIERRRGRARWALPPAAARPTIARSGHSARQAVGAFHGAGGRPCEATVRRRRRSPLPLCFASECWPRRCRRRPSRSASSTAIPALSPRPPTRCRRASTSTSRSTKRTCPPGVKIELIKRDDTSNPEVGKRLAQELITRDHVQLLTGIILSPVAAAVAPLTAEAKVPLVHHQRRRRLASRGSRLISCAPRSRCGSNRYRSANGRRSRAGRPAIPASPTSSPATTPKAALPRALPTAAARSSARSASRCRTRTSCRSCSASRTPSPTSPFCGCRRRPRRRR